MVNKCEDRLNARYFLIFYLYNYINDIYNQWSWTYKAAITAFVRLVKIMYPWILEPIASFNLVPT